MKKSQTFECHIDQLYNIINWVLNQLKTSRVSPSDQKKIELSVEEAVVNIISYAYPNNNPQGIIIDMDVQKKYVQITITDSGIPFDPLSFVKNIQKPASIEETVIGGLGVLFILSSMDKVAYQRINQKNILTIKKIL